MAITLRQHDADFEQRFAAFLSTKREVSADVEAVVRDIIARVRAEGDKALTDYTLKFDKADLGKLG
ncbi:MAG: histidinol dehydrogenase, partial [Mesorhizobium sp.]